jgi:hypothetical protein
MSMEALRIKMEGRVEGRRVDTWVNPSDLAHAESLAARSLPFHEASHAIVALHFGLRVRYVTINKVEAVEATGDPSAAGHCATEQVGLPPGDYCGPVGVLAMVAWAGIASDAKFGFPGLVFDPRTDPSAALAAAAVHAPRDVAMFNQLLTNREQQWDAKRWVNQFLLSKRDRVITLGTALRDRGRLTGDEVQTVLRGGA